MAGKFSDKLNDILDKISPTFTLISSITCIPIPGFIFNVTYMRANDFFSYEIFSTNFTWIFLFMGILLVVIHGIYVLGVTKNHQITNKRTIQIIQNQIIPITKNQRSDIIYYIFCTVINIFLIVSVFLVCCFRLYDDNIVFIGFVLFYIFLSIVLIMFWSIVLGFHIYSRENYIKGIALFIEIIYIVAPFIIFYFKEAQGLDSSFKAFAAIFLFFEILIIVISYVAIDIKRWFAAFILICWIISYSILLLVPLFPKYFNVNHICNKILKSINLASDHAEIYLKDKNKSVPGKLIFDDGKYAYVKFKNIDSNCSVGSNACEIVRKKVPSEDVSIITRVKKDTKASVPK